MNVNPSSYWHPTNLPIEVSGTNANNTGTVFKFQDEWIASWFFSSSTVPNWLLIVALKIKAKRNKAYARNYWLKMATIYTLSLVRVCVFVLRAHTHTHTHTHTYIYIYIYIYIHAQIHREFYIFICKQTVFIIKYYIYIYIYIYISMYMRIRC